MQYLIELDNEEYGDINKVAFDESGYKEGSILSERQLEDLTANSIYARAKNKAYYLISMREHSKKELEEKLYGEAEREVITDILNELENSGYINDERYAKIKAKQLFEYKKFPVMRVLRELRAKGIDGETAQVAVDEILEEIYGDDLSEVDRAVSLIDKKHYRKMRDEDGKRKVFASLIRYGFNYETVKSAIKKWEESNEDNNSD